MAGLIIIEVALLKSPISGATFGVNIRHFTSPFAKLFYMPLLCLWSDQALLAGLGHGGSEILGVSTQLLVHCSWDAAKPQLDIVRPALNAEDHFEASACRGAKCIHS